MRDLHPSEYELLIEAGRTCFWYKRPLRDFLKRAGIPPADLLPLDDMSKLNFMRFLVDRYEKSQEGRSRLADLAQALSRKSNFPDLETKEQQQAATAIVTALAESLGCLDSRASELRAQADQIARIPSANHSMKTRHELSSKLADLLPRIGTSEAGIAFESLICDLAESECMDVRRPYRIANSRQFDGSLEVDGIVYLLETKFTDSKSDSSDIANFRDKVLGNADLTQGVFISMTGYTGPALQIANRSKSPVVLLDGQHVAASVFSYVSFERIIRLAKRHASETGEALFCWADMQKRMNS